MCVLCTYICVCMLYIQYVCMYTMHAMHVCECVLVCLHLLVLGWLSDGSSVARIVKI